MYRIRVLSRPGERLGDCLGLDVKITEGEPVQTELSDSLADQAAVMGVLHHPYWRGMTILLVERLEPEDSSLQ